MTTVNEVIRREVGFGQLHDPVAGLFKRKLALPEHRLVAPPIVSRECLLKEWIRSDKDEKTLRFNAVGEHRLA